ncbi:hypothetical protein PVAG01_02159 [Phlyctema vagabunda]|uniref:Uncharacterized protein n=1 Tax=Phlyctema vagabunda TaxID=108571 RepID=A0ABR4PPV4_9HELO
MEDSNPFLMDGPTGNDVDAIPPQPLTLETIAMMERAGIKEPKFLYFAYGPEMSLKTMRKICPGAELRFPGSLDDSMFTITKCGEATVISCPTYRVDGMVYDLGLRDRYRLESWLLSMKTRRMGLTRVRNTWAPASQYWVMYHTENSLPDPHAKFPWLMSDSYRERLRNATSECLVYGLDVRYINQVLLQWINASTWVSVQVGDMGLLPKRILPKCSQEEVDAVFSKAPGNKMTDDKMKGKKAEDKDLGDVDMGSGVVENFDMQGWQSGEEMRTEENMNDIVPETSGEEVKIAETLDGIVPETEAIEADDKKQRVSVTVAEVNVGKDEEVDLF